MQRARNSLGSICERRKSAMAAVWRRTGSTSFTSCCASRWASLSAGLCATAGAALAKGCASGLSRDGFSSFRPSARGGGSWVAESSASRTTWPRASSSASSARAAASRTVKGCLSASSGNSAGTALRSPICPSASAACSRTTSSCNHRSRSGKSAGSRATPSPATAPRRNSGGPL